MAEKTFKGMADAVRKLKLQAFDDNVNGAAGNGLNEGLRYAQRLAVTKYMLGGGKNAPVNATKITIRKGNLRRSVRMIPATRSGSFFTGGLEAGGADVPYAGVQEFGGTIQHPGSKAEPGGVLHWLDKGGRDVFATSTRAHVITIPARPYMGPALRDAAPIVQEKVQARLAELARRIIEA